MTYAAICDEVREFLVNFDEEEKAFRADLESDNEFDPAEEYGLLFITNNKAFPKDMRKIRRFLLHQARMWVPERFAHAIRFEIKPPINPTAADPLGSQGHAGWHYSLANLDK